MKKLIVFTVVAALVGAFPSGGVAAKKKLKPVDKKFYLRDSDGCDSSEGFLSLEDGPDTGCGYLDSGLPYEVLIESGLLTADDLSASWTTSDGVPLQLNATKDITGEITTASISCVVTAAPCSPAGIGAGNATLSVKVVADEQTELGTFSESFTIAPGQTHTSKVKIELEDALNKTTFQTIKLLTIIHGAALGHTTVSIDEPASFVTIPSWSKKK